MNERRFEELEAKKRKTGLTKEEADELGRMYAEKSGDTYSNADQRRHPDELPPGDKEEPSTEDQVQEFLDRGGQSQEV